MIDLHLHLDGSLTAGDIIKAAAETGTKLEYTRDELASGLVYDAKDRSLVNYLKCFDIPCSIMQTPDISRFMVMKLLERLASHGVKYSEIRFAPQLHTLKGYSQEDIVKACIEGIDYAYFLGIDAKLILCMMRNDDFKANETTLELAKKYLGQGVVALDLAGDEFNNPTEKYKELFEYAAKKNIPFTIHAGEAGGCKEIWDAVSFGAKRIGHGIRAIDDLELMKYLRDHKIGLECCPTSNIQTLAVDSIEDHPLIKFLDFGILATVNTDNMTVSNTSLNKEFELIKNIPGYNESHKIHLLSNARAIAFK